MKTISKQLLDLVSEIEALEGENEELKDEIAQLNDRECLLEQQLEDAQKPL